MGITPPSIMVIDSIELEDSLSRSSKSVVNTPYSKKQSILSDSESLSEEDEAESEFYKVFRDTKTFYDNESVIKKANPIYKNMFRSKSKLMRISS